MNPAQWGQVRQVYHSALELMCVCARIPEWSTILAKSQRCWAQYHGNRNHRIAIPGITTG
jgi:hypothetical protein